MSVVVAVLVGAAVWLVAWPVEARLRRLVAQTLVAVPTGASPSAPGGAEPGRRVEIGEAALLDLVAAALQSGAPVSTALRVVGQVCGGELAEAARRAGTTMMLGGHSDEVWGEHSSSRLARVLDLARTSGAPAAALLEVAADTVRATSRGQARAAAARLGVRMTLPMGLCAVPAFVCWGVAPVVISLAADVMG